MLHGGIGLQGERGRIGLGLGHVGRIGVTAGCID